MSSRTSSFLPSSSPSLLRLSPSPSIPPLSFRPLLARPLTNRRLTTTSTHLDDPPSSSSTRRPQRVRPGASAMSPPFITTQSHLTPQQNIAHFKSLARSFNASLLIKPALPTPVLTAILATRPPLPFILAWEMLESLLDRYLPWTKQGVVLELPRSLLARAGKELDECRRALVAHPDLKEDSRKALNERVYPSLIRLWVTGRDWAAIQRLAVEAEEEGSVTLEVMQMLILSARRYVTRLNFQTVNPVHSTLLFTQLLAPCLLHLFPDPNASSQSSPERNNRTKLLTKFLMGLRSSLASSGEKEEAGRIVLGMIKRIPSLRSAVVLHELMLLLGYTSRLVDDAWELAQGDGKMLFSVAATYMTRLSTLDRASEIPQIVQLLRENAVGDPGCSPWPHLVGITAYERKEWSAAARIILDLVQKYGSEEDLLCSIARFDQVSKLPHGCKDEPKIRRAQDLLETKLGVDIWERAEIKAVEEEKLYP